MNKPQLEQIRDHIDAIHKLLEDDIQGNLVLAYYLTKLSKHVNTEIKQMLLAEHEEKRRKKEES
ncbi:unnamed protein product [marine sediment metagenome]|uniref:Uncharacterized protein n=1 Tax=marine sediment metagenome TaxID=412755 RepID=X1NMG9_9ZZZZ